jgi:ribose 5-phosphate isomerase A
LSETERSEAGKSAAGIRAAEAVKPGMKLGLGTGSTVSFFLEALGERFRGGELPGIVGVPTSVRTAGAARALGIPLVSLQEARTLDLTVDGADEVDPKLDLIKGLGGALLREKMVAQATQKLIIIIDEGKLVEQLGTRGPLPVEVVPFAWESHLPFFNSLGAETVIREASGGRFYETDNGNYLLHCSFPEGIPDPPGLQNILALRAGIVDTGLFLGMADEVFVGGEGGVKVVSRNQSGAESSP